MNFKSASIHAALVAGLFAALALTGCSGLNPTATVAPIQGSAFNGHVFGGQQPIAGSSIALYIASTSGYGATNANILTKAVTSDSSGNFNITSDYQCVPGQQLYIVATGGNPGEGTNNQAALMAALGDCVNLTPSSFISVNEVTTIGSVFALAPFMTNIASVSTSPTNTSGLVHAFASVNKLVDTARGISPGPALPSGATAPSDEIYTLANILAACINSTGGTAGDQLPGAAPGQQTTCGSLFTLTTPSSGVAPTDTIQAALNIAHHPASNVAGIFQLMAPQSPFAVTGSTTPKDWTLAVTYAAGGLQSPRSTTVDASGNIWIANAASNSVSVLAQTGVPLTNSPLTGNGLAGPTAVAIDATGNAWIANTAGTTISAFTLSGAAINGSPFSAAGTLSAPNALAFDAPGNLWITNGGNASITELTGAGTFMQQVANSNQAPSSLAVDPR